MQFKRSHLKQIMKEYWERKKDFFFPFIGLEKLYDSEYRGIIESVGRVQRRDEADKCLKIFMGVE